VKTGKWSDGDQWVIETAGASEMSEEVMTNSRMWFFVVRMEVDMLTKIERRRYRN